MPSPAPTRRRRTAEQARARILEAARKRLVEDGPEGLRLQELARDLDISHPAILHHFGSREGLLTALAAEGVRGLNEEVARRIQDEGPVDLRAILDLASEVLRESGQARLLAWLALSGRPTGQGPHVLGDLAQVSHEARAARREAAGEPTPDYEDTLFSVLLIALSLFGDALAGDLMRASAGVEGADGAARFRAWLAELMGGHFLAS